MPGSQLSDIRNLVRELTRSLSTNQLSDIAANNWINTFYVFDLPRIIRPDDLRVNVNILLNANQQAYPFNQYNTPTNLAYPNINTLNGWITSIYPPVYIGGRVAAYTQSQSEFFGLNPKNQAPTQAGEGTGAPMVINYQFPSFPVVPGQVVFSVLDATGHSIRRIDNGIGGFIDQLNNPIAGNINYVTGTVVGLDMGTPVLGAPIFGYSNPYQPSWPEMMLLFNNTLYFWPIPDQGYQVTFEADITVADMVNDTDQPLQPEWWQFIAYGAAIKILLFRKQKDAADELKEEFENQKDFVNRKLITSQSTNRTETIYSSQDSLVPFLNNSFGNRI